MAFRDTLPCVGVVGVWVRHLRTAFSGLGKCTPNCPLWGKKVIKEIRNNLVWEKDLIKKILINSVSM